MSSPNKIPVIDISCFRAMKDEALIEATASSIRDACMNQGFFYIEGHGVSTKLQDDLHRLSTIFFALSDSEKMKISMVSGGRAWRGYFPLGQEVTSGIPDMKEGLYFGTELDQSHSKVVANIPLHGANLFPEHPLSMSETVLSYIEVVTQVGHIIMRGIAISLGLEFNYFENSITKDPFILFRIFHYPPKKAIENWGVGEHTDYGLLTILKQDNIGGLQVKSNNEWIDAPPIPNTFVCNIGDMLDRMTNGLYRSTPHRVLNNSKRNRLSFPLFFDPNFDSVVEKLPISDVNHHMPTERWDGQDVYNFEGKYGDYVVSKVSKVFPKLFKQIME